MELNKITKKKFIELLCENSTAFISSVFNWDDNRIQAGISNLNPERVQKLKRRKVAKRQANGLQFDNGSWLMFDQNGTRSYYEYLTNGVRYILQKNTTEEQKDYIIYAI